MEIYSLGLQDEVGKELLPAQADVALYRKRRKQLRFIKAYIANGGMIGDACKTSRMSHSVYLGWKTKDPVFAAAMEKANMLTIDILEAEAIRRGVHGYDEPVFYQGNIVGNIRKYDSNLIIFRLKKLDPSYRDSHQTNIGVAGNTIKIEFVDPVKPTDLKPPMLENS